MSTSVDAVGGAALTDDVEPVATTSRAEASAPARFLRSGTGPVAAAVLLVVVLLAAFGPLLLSGDARHIDLSNTFGPAFSGGHLLGTDDLGRDVLSRVVGGARISLLAAVEATAIAAIVGLPVGLLAGYVGGAVDYVVMRVVDALMAFPALVLAVAIVGFVGAGLTTVMIAVGVVNIPRVVRVARALALSLRQEPYVLAARAMGVRHSRIMTRHVLRNMMSAVLVQISLTMALAMIAESSLSFLGLGVQPPDESWGSMLSRSMQFVDLAPWYFIGPAVMIVATVLALNVLGNAVHASLRPGGRS
jgi:ABC-type dipeptide/oligopeptide/nickel transport system permease subunit